MLCQMLIMKEFILCLTTSLFCLMARTQEPKFGANTEPKFKWGIDASGRNMAYINAAYSNYKTNYFVLKKDSTGTNVNSKIYVTDSGRFYVSTENKESSDEAHRIYADETIKINYDDQRFQKKFEGIALGNAWLFKVVEGKINLYSCYPEPDYLSNEAISAFQVGDGDIEPLAIDKLKLAVQNNPDAVKAIEKKDYLKAVKKFNKE